MYLRLQYYFVVCVHVYSYISVVLSPLHNRFPHHFPIIIALYLSIILCTKYILICRLSLPPLFFGAYVNTGNLYSLLHTPALRIVFEPADSFSFSLLRIFSRVRLAPM
jgi:hypothetical protein